MTAVLHPYKLHFSPIHLPIEPSATIETHALSLYNDYNTLLLGMILKRVTHQTLSEYL
jgi:CubicO group peptidase (beta-lactamase class C family)